jgi:hypothetical protein
MLYHAGFVKLKLSSAKSSETSKEFDLWRSGTGPFM